LVLWVYLRSPNMPIMIYWYTITSRSAETLFLQKDGNPGYWTASCCPKSIDFNILRMGRGHVGTSADWESTERERAISFPWYCHHRLANYCHVSSDTAAPKIYVRTYIDRFLIQVNNVMLLSTDPIWCNISTVIWTVHSRWKRRCGPGWSEFWTDLHLVQYFSY